MISPRRTLIPFLAALAALVPAAAAAAGDAVPRPILVELYTSQGCSSCPPADALLGRLAQRPGVIAISLPITYWDMLGWKDTLATEANTRRQKAYAAMMGHGGVYTPQIVIDGMMDVVGSRVGAVEAAIAQRRAMLAMQTDPAQAFADLAAMRAMAAAPPVPPPAALDPAVPVLLSETPRDMRIAIGAAPGARNATVWMFHLRASVSVDVPAGENEGRTLTYHNVVGGMKAVGVYRGRALTLTLPRAGMAGLPHDGVAVVVQQDGYGHVIGAAYASRPDYYAEQ